MTIFSARTESAGRFLEAAAARPGKVLLATDFDGTLAPIVENLGLIVAVVIISQSFTSVHHAGAGDTAVLVTLGIQ